VEVDTTLSDNFTIIDTELKKNKDDLVTHKNDVNAHTSDKITHTDGSVKDALENHEARLTQTTNNISTLVLPTLSDHSSRLDVIEPKVDTLETTQTNHETRISSNETKVANHEPRLAAVEGKASDLDTRVTDIEVLGIDKLAPNLEGRITTLESDIEGVLAPTTFDSLSQQNLTFDEMAIGYVDNKITPINEQISSLTSSMAENTKHHSPYKYTSDYKRIVPEADDSGKLQRAINDCQNQGMTLIINENLTIGSEIVISNQITIDGVSWRTSKITLTSANACINISKKLTNTDYVYEVDINNVGIYGQDIANYCLRANTTSQIKLRNVYCDHALVANIDNVNGSIIYFDKVYSYYSPIAFNLDTINNINFLNCNVWQVGTSQTGSMASLASPPASCLDAVWLQAVCPRNP
jgi:hypothetical protein